MADSTWTSAKKKSASLPEIAQFVTDGSGRTPQNSLATWIHSDAILNLYIDFVLRNYAEENIVFDGYESF